MSDLEDIHGHIYVAYRQLGSLTLEAVGHVNMLLECPVNEQHYCLGFIYRVGLNLPVYVIGIYENCGTFPGFPSDDSDGFLKPSTFAKYTGRDEVCDDFQQPFLESGFTNSWWPSEQTFEGFVSDHSLMAIFFKQSINL